MAKKNQTKLEKQNLKIVEFKKLLSETNQQIEKYKIKIKNQKDEMQNMISKISNYENQLSVQANDRKIDKDTIVGLEVAIYRLKSKIALLKEEKSRYQKQAITNGNSFQSVTTTTEILNNNGSNQVQKIERIEESNLNQINEELKLQINQLMKRNSELENLVKEGQNTNNLKRQIEKLQNLSEQQALIISTIQNISPDLDLSTYPQILARLVRAKEFSSIVLKTLSENDFDNALLKLTELKTDSVTMGRIRSVFANLGDNEIIEFLKNYKPFNLGSNVSISKKSNSSSKSFKFSSDIENCSSILCPSLSPIGKK